MGEVAKKAQVSRENLYDALSKTGKPQMETITKMLSSLGLRFSISITELESGGFKLEYDSLLLRTSVVVQLCS